MRGGAVRKVYAICAVILGLAVLIAVCTPAFAQGKTPKDVIILKGNPMGGVKFMHTAHTKERAIKCETCHHPSKTEKPATAAQQACSDCHQKAAAAPMKTNFKAAFHDATAKKGVCIDCHTKENAAG